MIRSWKEFQFTRLPWYAITVEENGDGPISGLYSEVIDEDTVLGLPSETTPNGNHSADFARLVEVEVELRLAEAREALGNVRKMVKMIGAVWDDKAINSRGVDQNTRSQSSARDLARKRDLHIHTYNNAREVIDRLKALGAKQDTLSLPALTVADTIRKTPEGRRVIGDSRHESGPVWTGQSIVEDRGAGEIGYGGDDDRESWEFDPTTRITKRVVGRCLTHPPILVT